jgi:hypothetical protein
MKSIFTNPIKGMLHIKQFVPEVYMDIINSMRDTYHTPKMSDDAITIDHWNKVDTYTEKVFLALKETL